MSDDPDSIARLRAVRLATLAGGSVSLLLAMLVFGERARPRDWAWAIGVALLILSIVANRMIARSSRSHERV